MPTLTVLFMTSDSWVSKLIRWFTKGRVSHVAIGMEVMGAPMVLHATVGGVQMWTRARATGGEILVAEYKIIPDITGGVKAGFEHLGDKYDYVGLFGYIFVMIGRLIKQKWKNPLASSHAWVCSEFVAHCDSENKLPEWHKYADSGTDPEDLLDACEASPDFERITAGAIKARKAA
jgi:hypothetical protein